MRKGRNPGKAYHLAKCWEHAEKGSRKGISPHMANWQAAQLSSEIEAARKSGATKAEIDEAVRVNNPGAKWHKDRADELRQERSRTKDSEQWNYLQQRVLENERAATYSRNPTRRKHKNPDKSILPILAFSTAMVLGISFLGKKMSE